ncbi:hypothetical protein fh0823_26590 [Francisella halioticida]|nr:hypothetical protein fh0823_26590 [Francisella halioticida]
MLCQKTDLNDNYLEELLAQEKQDYRFPTEELKNIQRSGRKQFTSLYTYDSEVLQYWTEKQVYISLGYILLSLATLEINSTPMEGIETHVIDEAFNLREKGLKTSVIVTIGYSSENDFNTKLPKSKFPKSKLPKEKIFTEI